MTVCEFQKFVTETTVYTVYCTVKCIIIVPDTVIYTCIVKFQSKFVTSSQIKEISVSCKVNNYTSCPNISMSFDSALRIVLRNFKTILVILVIYRNVSIELNVQKRFRYV